MSRPKRAVSARPACPTGIGPIWTGAEGGLAGVGGSAWSTGPLGVAVRSPRAPGAGPGAARLAPGGAAGAVGTSPGGRGALGPSKNCAAAIPAEARSHAAARAKRPARPQSVTALLMLGLVDRNRGKFKPLHGLSPTHP